MDESAKSDEPSAKEVKSNEEVPKPTGVTAEDLKGVLAEAIKPVQDELKSLKAENAALKSRLAEVAKPVPGTPAPREPLDLAKVWAKAIEKYCV